MLSHRLFLQRTPNDLKPSGLQRVPFLIVMAVGPGERLGALELLDSARTYLRGPYRAIVVDDTGDLGTWRAISAYPEVDLLRNWRRRGFRHLVASLQRAYRYAVAQYAFEAILKVDTDTLITGSDLDADILAFVREHPSAGMLGSQTWPERVDPSWGERLEENLAIWRPIIERAERQGYRLGDSVQGGAYVLSRPCLDALAAQGFLHYTPRGPRIPEDVTFSLFVRALGYELQDFSGPMEPFALAYRGLLMPPRELLGRGKKVVHSVKLTPEDILHRIVFARARHRVLAANRNGRAEWRTIGLAGHSRRLRVWLRWRAVGTQALREKHRRRAWRIFRRCVMITPAQPEAWLGLMACLLPSWVYGPLRLARVYVLRGLGRHRVR